MSGLEPASTRLPISSASTVPLSCTDTLSVSESLQNWSASRCAFFDQSYATLPNVRSYVQEKYSQGRNGAFPDMVSLPRMIPLTLRHVWLPFVGELLNHSVFRGTVVYCLKALIVQELSSFWQSFKNRNSSSKTIVQRPLFVQKSSMSKNRKKESAF